MGRRWEKNTCFQHATNNLEKSLRNWIWRHALLIARTEDLRFPFLPSPKIYWQSHTICDAGLWCISELELGNATLRSWNLHISLIQCIITVSIPEKSSKKFMRNRNKFYKSCGTTFAPLQKHLLVKWCSPKVRFWKSAWDFSFILSSINHRWIPACIHTDNSSKWQYRKCIKK